MSAATCFLNRGVRRRAFGFWIWPILMAVLPCSAAPTISEMVPMRDGVRLATDVYLPPLPGPHPVTLIRTVYNKDWAIDDPTVSALAITMAIVVQDCRGRYASEGVDCLFQCDRDDGHDTMAWVAAQPWCNGRIVTQGASALGIVQYQAAPEAPDALEAMYVMVATPTVCEHTMFVNGVFREAMVEGWLEGQGSSFFLDSLAAHPDCADPFWDAGRIDLDYDLVNAPTVHVGGWFDIFTQGTLDAFMGFQTQATQEAREHQYLIMGPWTHGFDFSFPVEGQALPFTFPNPFPDDFIDPIWWTLHFLGLDDSGHELDDLPPVQYYVMGDVSDPNAPGNDWRHAASWPIPAVHVPYYLRAGGGLSELPPEASGGATPYTYDPSDPCPTLGGGNLILPAGPQDQRPIELRNDVIVFQTEQLSRPLEITGRVRARFYVSADVPDTDVVVRLCDVYPDGKSMLFLDAPARLSLSGPYTPNTVVPVDVDLWSTSLILNQGHRLRISVTSSNWPRFRANPNDGSRFGAGMPQIAHVQIHHSADFPSYVLIPDPNRSSVQAWTRWIPHITAVDGGFSTRLLAENHTDHTAAVTLHPFAADGVVSSPVTLNLTPNQVMTLDVDDLFQSHPSHLAISDGPDVSISVAYAATSGAANPAHVRETSLASQGWSLFPGNWQIVFDGFACVNLGTASTDVRVLQFDASGALLQERIVHPDLAPGAKALTVIGAPSGSDFIPSEGGHFQIRADQPLALTALRGSPPDVIPGFLFENVALPIP